MLIIYYGSLVVSFILAVIFCIFLIALGVSVLKIISGELDNIPFHMPEWLAWTLAIVVAITCISFTIHGLMTGYYEIQHPSAQ